MFGRKWKAGRGVEIGFLILVTALWACQSKNEKQGTQSLEQRVTGFWESRIRKDYIEAYKHEVASQNGTTEMTAYVRQQNPGIKYKAFVIREAKETGDKAEVKVAVDYTMQAPMLPEVALHAIVTGEWIRLDKGQWYRDTKPWRPSQTG